VFQSLYEDEINSSSNTANSSKQANVQMLACNSLTVDDGIYYGEVVKDRSRTVEQSDANKVLDEWRPAVVTTV